MSNNNLQNNIHAGHRRRMMQKMCKYGLDSFEDHEILEMLLYYTNTRKNTNPIAHALINRFGTLANVFEAEISELVKVEGVGQRTAELIHFSHGMFRAYSRSANNFTQHFPGRFEIGKFLVAEYAGKTKEEFGVLTLDGKMCYKGFHILERGSLDSVSVNIRKLVEVVLGDNASCVVLCHNHPGGTALPSKNDVMVTVGIIQTLMTIGVMVMDHFVIAGGTSVSMATSQQYKKHFLVQYKNNYQE